MLTKLYKKVLSNLKMDAEMRGRGDPQVKIPHSKSLSSVISPVMRRFFGSMVRMGSGLFQLK